MGSIYRKGRDGYFYYQTYVYNKKTGKKDKKIFHALRTKDHSEAQKEKIKYDQIYNLGSTNSFNIKFIPGRKNLTAIGLLVCTSFFLLTMVLSNKNIKKNNDDDMNVNDLKSELVVEDKMEPTVFDKSSNRDKIKDDRSENSTLTSMAAETSKEKDFLNEKDLQIENSNTINNEIPKFVVYQEQNLSKIFEQGEINVLVNSDSNDDEILLLCRHLRKKYKQFSNLIICIYSDNEIGKDLAGGNKEQIRSDLIQKNWLAMYSYNSVEGEFFNNNPASYLGSY